MSTTHEPKPQKILVDNVPYNWPKATITGAEIRQLASLPDADAVDLFHKVPGKPDEQLSDSTIVNLNEQSGADHFSSHTVGSKAGA